MKVLPTRIIRRATIWSRSPVNVSNRCARTPSGSAASCAVGGRGSSAGGAGVVTAPAADLAASAGALPVPPPRHPTAMHVEPASARAPSAQTKRMEFEPSEHDNSPVIAPSPGRRRAPWGHEARRGDACASGQQLHRESVAPVRAHVKGRDGRRAPWRVGSPRSAKSHRRLARPPPAERPLLLLGLEREVHRKRAVCPIRGAGGVGKGHLSGRDLVAPGGGVHQEPRGATPLRDHHPIGAGGVRL